MQIKSSISTFLARQGVSNPIGSLQSSSSLVVVVVVGKIIIIIFAALLTADNYSHDLHMLPYGPNNIVNNNDISVATLYIASAKVLCPKAKDGNPGLSFSIPIRTCTLQHVPDNLMAYHKRQR